MPSHAFVAEDLDGGRARSAAHGGDVIVSAAGGHTGNLSTDLPALVGIHVDAGFFQLPEVDFIHENFL